MWIMGTTLRIELQPGAQVLVDCVGETRIKVADAIQALCGFYMRLTTERIWFPTAFVLGLELTEHLQVF